MRSAAHGMLSLHVSNVLGVCRGVRMQLHTSYAEGCCMLNRKAVNGKAMIIHLIVGLIKKTLHQMIQYFPKPYEPFGGHINVKVDLPNCATKVDLKKS